MRIELSSVKKIKAAMKDLDKLKRRDRKRIEKMIEKIKDRLDMGTMKRLIKDLTEYPDRRLYPQDYPIKFTSDKQRKYVMAKLNGKAYERTGNLANGWRWDVIYKNGRIRVMLGNDNDYYKYVIGYYGVGKRTRDIRNYLKPVQAMHVVTGWKPAYQTVHKYIKRIQRDVERSLT